jgi:hypothetical protein
VAQKGAAWLRRVRRGSDSSASDCCTYGRPEFESRLGTPEEALYRAESNEDNKSSIYKILYVCSINVKINKKSGSAPPNLYIIIFILKQ